MPPTTTRWHASPHTLAKHEIIRKYIDAWLPIMSSGYRRIGIIDGFSGPGEYAQKDGSVLEGSPIILLRALLDHSHLDMMLERTEFLYLFIDADNRRARYLKKKALPKLGKLPKGIDVDVTDEPFDVYVNGIFDSLDEEGSIAVPLFVLVDPFGFKDVPFDLIARILKNPHSEVMVTFMVDSINRFLEHPDDQIIEHLEILLGMERDGWDDVLLATNRFDAIRDLYEGQLRQHAQFVRSFRMISKQNRPIYELIFASNHVKGLKHFKHAMWKVDPVGGGSFSDVTAGMETLFGPDPDTRPLQKALLKRFAGECVSIHEVERFVLEKTAYHDSHIKKRTLIPLEEAGKITYVPPKFTDKPRRGMSYPDRCQIEFP